MTLSTSINSMLLTFAPLVVTYQGLNLKKFNAYPGCFFGALAFLLTQIAKFIILAFMFPIFFPSEEFEGNAVNETTKSSAFVVEHEILRAVVSTIDIVGLYMLFNSKRLIYIMGDIEIKIISVGLGWAFADLLTSNFLDIIFQGWSNEMKLEYLVQSLQANIDIFEIISMAGLAYTLTKGKDESAKSSVVYALVLARYLFPVAVSYVKEEHIWGCDESEWCRESCFLGAKAAFAAVLHIVSKQLQ